MSDNPYASDPDSAVQPASRRVWLEVLVAVTLLAILAALFLPGVQTTHRGGRRTQCKNNLKQIGLALHNYHDIYDSFPPAFTVDDHGRRLHSWRVLLLPFVEQNPLYEKLDLTKPWNHPVNAAIRNACPDVFRCKKAELPPGYTTYKAAVGPGAVFGRDGRATRIDDIRDGTSQTILVVEATRHQASHWMDPYDDDGLALLELLATEPDTTHRAGTYVLFADGSVCFLECDTKPEVLRALTTMDAAETIDHDEF